MIKRMSIVHVCEAGLSQFITPPLPSSTCFSICGSPKLAQHYRASRSKHDSLRNFGPALLSPISQLLKVDGQSEERVRFTQAPFLAQGGRLTVGSFPEALSPYRYLPSVLVYLTNRFL